MTTEDVLYRRLYTQRLLGKPFERPEEVVSWLVGVRSQDYPGASWSLAQRVRGCTEADVRRAFDEGRILRTHLLRMHLALRDAGRYPRAATASYAKGEGAQGLHDPEAGDGRCSAGTERVDQHRDAGLTSMAATTEAHLFAPLHSDELTALEETNERYGTFVSRPATVELSSSV